MRVTVSTVTEAVIDTMRAANPDGILDHALAARVAGEIRPSLERALKARVTSGAELAGMSEFRTALSNHLGSSKSAHIESEARKALQRTLETANRTGSHYASAAASLLRGSAHAVGEASREAGGEARRSGDRAVAALAREAPLTMSGAVNFAKELGINPAYAGFFAGGSADMRNALRDALTRGTAISEDKVKSMHDVGMVIGAIRAGKLSPDDPRIPDSVKKIITDMKAQGIDPKSADQKTIRGYLRANPHALKAAKKRDQADTNANVGHTTEAKKQVVEAGPKRARKAAKLDGTASL